MTLYKSLYICISQSLYLCLHFYKSLCYFISVFLFTEIVFFFQMSESEEFSGENAHCSPRPPQGVDCTDLSYTLYTLYIRSINAL